MIIFVQKAQSRSMKLSKEKNNIEWMCYIFSKSTRAIIHTVKRAKRKKKL